MKNGRQKYLMLISLSACLFLWPAPVKARIATQQKTLALIAADKNEMTRDLAEILESSLENSFRFSDPELTQQVINSSNEKTLLNLSSASARNIGAGIGCDFYLILKSENLRRSSSQKNVYYEAYLAAFLVNARSGKLLAWKHLGAEADSAPAADKALLDLFRQYVREIPETLRGAAAEEQKNIFDTSIYEITDESGPALRTPLPFQRFSPAATPLAQHLRIEAVVDIEVAIDAGGYITQTRIARWAGFGLDEAVTETVRKMNFRPAILGGKTIPARFILRYNFRVPVGDKSR